MNLSGTVRRPGAIGWSNGVDAASLLQVAPYVHFAEPKFTYVGEEDFTLHVFGIFKAGDVIVWNGGDEVTTHVSDGELTTGVKPSTATGPHRVTIQVKRGARISRPIYFQFLPESANPNPPEPPPEGEVGGERGRRLRA